MISIAALLIALTPAQAQSCGVIEIVETSTADYDEDNDWVEVTQVGGVVQLKSGCEGSCQWTLHDPNTTDGQTVGKLVDIDNEANQDVVIVAEQVWYETPADLNDCVDVRSIVELNCSRLEDENTTEGDSVEIVTVSPYVERCSVTGGGCIAPQGSGVQQAGGWLLLPLLGLLYRRREN